MNKINIYIVVLFFATINVQLNAQTKNKKPCNSKEYKQFDFWLGNWNVYNVKNQLIGTNKIVKMKNACAIQENWKSKTSQSKGTSYNFYNATDKIWNQVWIDNIGGSLELKGTYKNNKMILKSKLISGTKGDYYNQITWFNNSDGTVTQLWELLDINNTPFNEIFRGTYKKITK